MRLGPERAGELLADHRIGRLRTARRRTPADCPARRCRRRPRAPARRGGIGLRQAQQCDARARRSAIAAQMRGTMRSRRNAQLSSATTAGIEAMMTPADTALVRLTPNSMQMENRKLPRKDSRNTSRRVCARHRRLVGGLAQPVQHGQAADAEAQPGQQEHGNRRDQRLGQGDIAAHQRHAQGQAGIREQALERRGHSAMALLHNDASCPNPVGPSGCPACLRPGAQPMAHRGKTRFRNVKSGHAAARRNFSI